MDIIEAYEKWKKNPNNIGTCCVYGGIVGGQGQIDDFGGCEHSNHPNVRYGHDRCPNGCKDFKLQEDKRLYKDFLILYALNPDWYNEKYDIDSGDGYIDTIGERKNEHEKLMSEIKNIEELCEVMGATEDGYLCSIDKENINNNSFTKIKCCTLSENLRRKIIKLAREEQLDKVKEIEQLEYKMRYLREMK